MDGHRLKFGAPIFRDGLLATAAVVEDESESATLFFKDVFFHGIEIKTAGQLDIVRFGHSSSKKSSAIEKHPGVFVKSWGCLLAVFQDISGMKSKFRKEAVLFHVAVENLEGEESA
jgi:hypothetical protein